DASGVDCSAGAGLGCASWTGTRAVLDGAAPRDGWLARRPFVVATSAGAGVATPMGDSTNPAVAGAPEDGGATALLRVGSETVFRGPAAEKRPRLSFVSVVAWLSTTLVAAGLAAAPRASVIPATASA